MNATILAKQCGIDSYEWLRLENPLALPPVVSSQLMVGDGERLQQEGETASITVLVDADIVRLTIAQFEAHERKMLRQTLPYSFEDDCVEDVDELHFALGEVGDNRVPLAMIKRDSLQQLLHDYEQFEPQQLVSELLFLPLQENSWTLVIDGERWLLRVTEHQAYAFDADMAALALQLLLDETEQIPEQLQVYCSSEQQSECLSLTPDLLRGGVVWHDADYWQVIAEGYLQSQQNNMSVINLLQGVFSRPLPWKQWWNSWRVAAMLLVAVILVQFFTTFTQLNLLKKDNLQLRADIEKTYRSVVPRGAVLDPERQLQRKLNALKGSTGEGFVSLLAQISTVLSSIDGLSVQSINYTEKQSEVRLTILAASFDDVETARTNIEKLGLKAELKGSSADGNKTRARLQIRG